MPNDICAPENIYQLSLYYYKDTFGWVRVENQNADSMGGFVEGLVDGVFPFVILGPEEIVKGNTEEKFPIDKQGETSNRGIFSPGLPGEIPSIFKKKGQFYFSIQQGRQILPKPLNLPAITNEEINKQSDEIKNLDEMQHLENKDKTPTKRNTDEKTNNKKSHQNKLIKKNFSVKK